MEQHDDAKVGSAVDAIRGFGGDDLNVDDAATLLALWCRYADLNQSDIAAILGGFPERPERDGEWERWLQREPLTGGGWISGPSIGGPES